uniref:Global nitrogen transcriptional regulator n=1 Tax=Antithamnionella ternifolia TaxID=207919 RepID=A0A4D6WKE3_9FLOR|nr:global nitrogen transcriptional regulator [Antithamnionella ternifolia]
MKWIHYFSNSKIPFYIYYLKKGDSIIKITNRCYNSSIIILHGTLYVLKLFINKEAALINIVNKNCIIDIKKNIINNNSYYKIIALEEAYILSFPSNFFENTKKININLYISLIKSYKNTLNNYESINQILQHIYFKHRIVQLLLFLFIECGTITQTSIKTSFNIHKNDIAIMIGANTNTINKIIKQLEHSNIINYSNYYNLKLENKMIYRYLMLLN